MIMTPCPYQNTNSNILRRKHPEDVARVFVECYEPVKMQGGIMLYFSVLFI